jgi:hypothetical protein
MQVENKHLYDVMPGNDERALGKNLKISALMNPPNPGVYERGIVPAIYPAINKISFQAGKPDRMFLGRHDDWFYQLHGGIKIWEMMQSDLGNLIRSLDSKFLLNDQYRGLLGFKYWRKYYRLGPVTNFSPSPVDIIVNNNLDDLLKGITDL